MKGLTITILSILFLGMLLYADNVPFNPDHLTTVGNSVYFSARDEQGIGLWKTDGTAAGTVLVKHLIAGIAGTLDGFRNVGGILFFFVQRGPVELWKSDGTPAGTRRIVNLGAHLQGGLVAAAVGNRLYFVSDDGVHGRELWISDGTAAGTRMVKDLNPGSEGSDPQDLAVLNGKLLFSAVPANSSRALFRSNGSRSSTVLLNQWESGSTVGEMTPFGSKVYFAANNQLWKTNGTPGGTAMVSGNFSGIRELTVVQNSLYFVANGTNDTRLWRMDGAENFHLVRRDPSSCRCAPHNLTAVSSYLLFMDSVKDKGNGLWRTAGTKEGTSIVRAMGTWDFEMIHPVNTATGSTLMNLTHYNQLDRLWISNGDPAGTFPLSVPLGGPFDPNRPSGANSSTVLKGFYIFSAGKWNADGYYDYSGHIWRSDGTVTGTYVLR